MRDKSIFDGGNHKMLRKYLSSVCAILCIFLSGCGSQNDSVKDIDTVLQSKEEIRNSNEMTEEFNGQEVTSVAPLFFVEMEDEYPRGTRINEQTFDVELRPFGKVTFASYTPDTWDNDYADAVFLVEQNSNILSQLPAAFENNIGTELFHSVDAVSFLDYDEDGFDDIIIILSYISNDGQSTLHNVVRYYRGGENGIFTYEQEMSESGSSALANITIASAKDFIGYKDLSYDDSSADETYIYKDVLEQYQDMVQNDFYKSLIDSDNYDSSFGEAIGLEIRHLVQDIYYALYDIDGNGTAELIIAGGENRNANADNSPWNYDLYGYDGTNVVHIFSDMEFGYRTNFSLYENGVIAIFYSNSAAESGVDFYKIGNDGFTPEKIDSFAMVGHLEGDAPVFDYLQNGNEITEDEYNANVQCYEIALAKGLNWIQIQ